MYQAFPKALSLLFPSAPSSVTQHTSTAPSFIYTSMPPILGPGRIGPSFLCPDSPHYRLRKVICLHVLTKPNSKRTSS